jgi:hypothetical protein
MASWTKLNNGEWGIKVENAQYYPDQMIGTPIIVTNKAGDKTEVIIGKHVSGYMPKGGRGRHTDIYEVEKVVRKIKVHK